MRDRVLALDDVLGADDEMVAVAAEDAPDRGEDLAGGPVGLLDPGDGPVRLDEVAGGGEELGVAGRATGVSYDSRLVTFTRFPRSVSMISTMPSMRLISALPFGLRASKSSSTRGRPAVMSRPATPPVWNVRMVSCVPGSPIDCAAMMPTASPTPTGRQWRGCGRSRSGRRRNGPRR